MCTFEFSISEPMWTIVHAWTTTTRSLYCWHCRRRCQTSATACYESLEYPAPQMPQQSKNSSQGKKTRTYLFVNVVAAELDGAIRHNPHAIRAIARHHPAPALLAPHFAQSLSNAHLVLFATDILHLQQDFEALERRDDCARDGACCAAGDERGDDDLREPRAEAVEGCGFDGGFYGGGG
jgi:hypothetical protein